eukprot:1040483-Amphidinium_carterae.1
MWCHPCLLRCCPDCGRRLVWSDFALGTYDCGWEPQPTAEAFDEETLVMSAVQGPGHFLLKVFLKGDKGPSCQSADAEVELQLH